MGQKWNEKKKEYTYKTIKKNQRKTKMRKKNKN